MPLDLEAVLVHPGPCTLVGALYTFYIDDSLHVLANAYGGMSSPTHTYTFPRQSRTTDHPQAITFRSVYVLSQTQSILIVLPCLHHLSRPAKGLPSGGRDLFICTKGCRCSKRLCTVLAKGQRGRESGRLDAEEMNKPRHTMFRLSHARME